MLKIGHTYQLNRTRVCYYISKGFCYQPMIDNNIVEVTIEEPGKSYIEKNRESNLTAEYCYRNGINPNIMCYAVTYRNNSGTGYYLPEDCFIGIKDKLNRVLDA